jgi:pimeloyl-ACP methyl ester carboxylesterase
MHRQYVHAGNRTIAYYDSAPGNTSAKVAVLLHAFPLAASMWEPQFKAVPAGWRLIAPDLRGFGGSTLDHEPDSPSMDDYARDVAVLLSELGVTSAVMAGCSMGGYAVFAVLRNAPRLVRGLVLVDTRAGADNLEGRANRRSMLAKVDREGASGVAQEMTGKLIGHTTAEERPDIESSVRRLIKQQEAAALRGAILRMMDRPDSFPTLKTVTVPTLIVVGQEDTITPVAEAQKLAEAVPNAELVIVPRAGHLANLEQPQAFNAAFSNFLSRL